MVVTAEACRGEKALTHTLEWTRSDLTFLKAAKKVKSINFFFYVEGKRRKCILLSSEERVKPITDTEYSSCHYRI